MTNHTRKIINQAQPLLSRYGVTDIEIDADHVHPIAHCTMLTGIVIRVAGVPNTTSTEIKHIAQNILKRARVAERVGQLCVSYAGGK